MQLSIVFFCYDALNTEANLCSKSNLFDLQQRRLHNENIDKGDNIYICSSNIWCVSVIRVNTLENIVCQNDFGKDSLENFIWQSLRPV